MAKGTFILDWEPKKVSIKVLIGKGPNLPFFAASLTKETFLLQETLLIRMTRHYSGSKSFLCSVYFNAKCIEHRVFFVTNLFAKFINLSYLPLIQKKSVIKMAKY